MGAVRLHVECEGTGPPIVLAHGFAGSARNWRPQARALAGTYRVCRFDCRGHARSAAPVDPAAYTVAAFVDDFDRVVRRAGSSPVVAGGLSMGAAIALAWAAARPERARGVVLASPPAGAGSGTGLETVADDFAAMILRDGVEAAGARYAWGPDSGLDAAGARLVRRGFLEHPAHGLACTLRGVVSALPDPLPLVVRVVAAGIPLLLVVGDRDRAAVTVARRMVARAPGARLEVVADAGHVVNLERSGEVTAVLERWLAAIAARG
jgi:2-succinyl-6-hydroxy-2,4-cyclohexadiene-1-carboxylate synthase